MSAADRAAPVGESGDVASAETVLPIAIDAVENFLADTERLLRINPQLAVERLEPHGGGFHLVARNESNERQVDTQVLVESAPPELTLRYASGLKQATQLRVEPASAGTRLVVTEHYPRIEDAQDPRVAEVDRSLVPWVAAIRRHLLARARWGWLPGWSWWHERVMLSMAPRSRRIVRLLVWITVLEFAVFLAAVVVLRFVA
jgi:hypothetical protein